MIAFRFSGSQRERDEGFERAVLRFLQRAVRGQTVERERDHGGDRVHGVDPLDLVQGSGLKVIGCGHMVLRA